MVEAAGKRRVLLLFSVLAGLFLMHGLTGGDSCHGMPPTAMTSMVMGPDHTVHATTVAISSPDPMPGHTNVGEICVPLRPEGISGLFLVLFLIVITVWRPRLPFGARLIRAHWPHGPPRTGVQVLHTLSISRT